MRGPFFIGIGGVLSADIAAPDHEREREFYAKVLTTGPEPLWRDDLTNCMGTPVIGLGARTPEYESLPLQWMPHVQVSDVATSAGRAVDLGGRELMHGKGDDGRSLWAVLADPAGAAFGVIPVAAGESQDAGPPMKTGRIAWLSLEVADVPAVYEFYERVVGWSAAPASADGGRELRRHDGVAVGEIRPQRGGSDVIPSVWLLHLPVGDLEASLRRVRAGGGEVVREAAEGAVIRDPVGVCIALQALE
ncbi:MAG: hypothetical protein D6693_08980 [Planctomycetota bacterium]|nr:MAG: hypothetical protein D6693_08980 [Planctomycetota bacterium]